MGSEVRDGGGSSGYSAAHTGAALPGQVFIGMDFARQPSLWRRMMAKLFGQRMIGKDATVMVTMRFYNGCYYVEDVRQILEYHTLRQQVEHTTT